MWPNCLATGVSIQSYAQFCLSLDGRKLQRRKHHKSSSKLICSAAITIFWCSIGVPTRWASTVLLWFESQTFPDSSGGQWWSSSTKAWMQNRFIVSGTALVHTPAASCLANFIRRRIEDLSLEGLQSDFGNKTSTKSSKICFHQQNHRPRPGWSRLLPRGIWKSFESKRRGLCRCNPQRYIHDWNAVSRGPCGLLSQLQHGSASLSAA